MNKGQPTELDKQWGARLRAVRLTSGLSQKRLGELIGLDASVASARINRYELGVHRPDLLTVHNLARELDVSVPFFFAETDAAADLLYRLHKAPRAVRSVVKGTLSKIPAMPAAQPLKHTPQSRRSMD